MRTMTLEHPALSEFDHILVERLRPLTMPVDRRFGAIRIGVANGDGDLYRVIETSSLVEAVRVFEALKDLGLVPRRKAGRAMRVFQAA